MAAKITICLATSILVSIFCLRSQVSLKKLHRSYNQDMNDLSFEWNERKAAENIKKHGVSFDEAKSVFVDERAKLIDDPDHSYNEDRFVILGISSVLRMLLVCHCYRSDGNVIRIISARKASAKESKSYP